MATSNPNGKFMIPRKHILPSCWSGGNLGVNDRRPPGATLQAMICWAHSKTKAVANPNMVDFSYFRRAVNSERNKDRMKVGNRKIGEGNEENAPKGWAEICFPTLPRHRGKDSSANSMTHVIWIQNVKREKKKEAKTKRDGWNFKANDKPRTNCGG